MGQITLGFEGRAKARRQTGPARPDRYIAPLSLFASPEAIFVPDSIPDGPIPSRAQFGHCRGSRPGTTDNHRRNPTHRVPERGVIKRDRDSTYISGPGLFL